MNAGGRKETVLLGVLPTRNKQTNANYADVSIDIKRRTALHPTSTSKL